MRGWVLWVDGCYGWAGVYVFQTWTIPGFPFPPSSTSDTPPPSPAPTQAYRLSFSSPSSSPPIIRLRGSDARGLLYGAQTLAQIVALYGEAEAPEGEGKR